MPQTFLRIRGIDPLLFRDGRPFTTEAGGLTARSLPLPVPSTVAAFVRTQYGIARGWRWTEADCDDAHGIPVHGPLLVRNDGIVLPAPLDALVTSKDVPPLRLSPHPEFAAFCNLPDGMAPVMLPPGAKAEAAGKPLSGYNYWPVKTLLDWLEERAPEDLKPIGGLPREERIGIGIDPDSRRARDGVLYAVELRSFGDRLKADHGEIEWSDFSLIVRTKLGRGEQVLAQGSLGGERRLTIVEPVSDTPDVWPRCPQSLKERLANATQVRMVLATPACFSEGWKPGWIDRSGSGALHLPAGIGKVQLKLVAAAVGRQAPVSGWGAREGNRKPRPIRWLAPAGSTYFFEVTGGDPSALCDEAWMKPVSDIEQDRRDGLGLALWGTW